jgi:hypothetical protein
VPEEGMTAKRDLKRRVRQRQARTGEAYVTARRHVVAASSDTTEDPDPEAADTDDPEAGTDPGRQASEVDVDPEVGACGQTAHVGGGTDTAHPGAEVTAGAGPDRASAEVGDATDPATGAGAAEAAAVPGTAVPVVELIDVTDQARRVGLMCYVTMFPSLAERVDPARVLRQLRDLLVETADDPQMVLLAQLGLAGHAPGLPTRPTTSFEGVRTFLRRALSGLGGVSEDGSMFAFHVAGQGGIVPVQCALYWHGPGLMLSAIDHLVGDTQALRNRLIVERMAPGSPARRIGDYLVSHRVPRMPSGPTLFVVHDGRRYAITQDEFLIGRNSRDVHLAIKDGLVSRHHAAVIRRHGVHYLKDLGSTHGIHYKGMQIDTKRIDEGDAFQIGDHELRFTYRSDDEK